MVVNVMSGEVVERTDYDEYGNILERSEIPTWSGQPFAYAGGLYDSQIKLIRFGARDYDAQIGRWTCKDPIGFGGGVSNLYEYVINDPINLFDISGFQLTDAQVANIIFNETRSLSGPDIATARQNMAHSIINGDNALDDNRPATAPTNADVPESERGTYQACQAAVTAARQDIQNEIDPTNGAMNFNMRNGPSRGNFFRTLEIQTQVGPLQNSYPGGGLGRDSVYANTYRGRH